MNLLKYRKSGLFTKIIWNSKVQKEMRSWALVIRE